MMARSTKGSNQRPDTLMQDRTVRQLDQSSLATHGRTIHQGQERRIGAVRNISALPLRADVGADIVERPFRANFGLVHRNETTCEVA